MSIVIMLVTEQISSVIIQTNFVLKSQLMPFSFDLLWICWLLIHVRLVEMCAWCNIGHQKMWGLSYIGSIVTMLLNKFPVTILANFVLKSQLMPFFIVLLWIWWLLKHVRSDEICAWCNIGHQKCGVFVTSDTKWKNRNCRK